MAEDIFDKYIKGQATLKEVVGFDEESINALLSMGYSLYTEGKLADAKVMFEGITALDPENKYAHGSLGAIYLQEGDLDKALEELNAAVKLNPQDISSYVNRGETYLKKGLLQESADDFHRAMELDPNYENPGAQRARAIVIGIDEIVKEVRRQGLA